VEEAPVFAAEVARPGDGRVIVKASGELDLSSAPELEAALREAQAERGEVVLDFSELAFIDSTGVHVVLGAFHAAESAGMGFAITGVAGEVLRAFELVGLVDRLPFR
jgi:anti-sigma B factor antagonist